jgi:hypothetical protein
MRSCGAAKVTGSRAAEQGQCCGIAAARRLRAGRCVDEITFLVARGGISHNDARLAGMSWGGGQSFRAGHHPFVARRK